MSTTNFSGPVASSNGFQSGSGSVLTPTAATTLTSADNGKTVMLNASVGFTITLPAHSAGLSFKFITGAVFATTNFVIIAPTAGLDTLEGSLIVAGAVVTVNAADQINFVATAENIGDFVTLFSDGATWHIFGNALSTGAITATG